MKDNLFFIAIGAGLTMIAVLIFFIIVDVSQKIGQGKITTECSRHGEFTYYSSHYSCKKIED